MSDHPSSSGPWRVLIHDSDPADPKWILATVASPADVRPAGAAEEAPDDLADAWLRLRNGGGPYTLTPLHGALCWRVDEAAQQ
jgi:hypothetical protein